MAVEQQGPKLIDQIVHWVGVGTKDAPVYEQHFEDGSMNYIGANVPEVRAFIESTAAQITNWRIAGGVLTASAV